MDGLIQPGDTLRMERAGAVLAVEKRIGEGGQGVVHVARLNGAPFAVKWFRPGLGSDEMRTSITALIQRGRPPHPAFVWPIDLVSSWQMPGFGYVMPLLEPRFVSLAQLLNQDLQPSFRVITTIGRELVDAFAALHSAGLCYRDISFGNLRVDPVACEAAIIDVDNVGVDGGNALVKGTGPFMAPELLRDEAFPSTVTDLHSQAGQCCWNCSARLPVPVTLKLRGSLLVLSEGAVLTSHHLNRDRDYRKACAVVEPNPRQPGLMVLRNLTDRIWTVVPDGEEPKRVAPNQRLGVRPMRIDFGPARGQIL